MTPSIAAAAEAVRAGIEVVADWRVSGRDLHTVRVGDTPGDEFVTAVDRAAEEAIREVLHRLSPGIPVLGENAADVELARSSVWVVDPVDGTTNLVNGDSFVSVTVALLARGEPVLGATGCPFTREIWTARTGEGAHDAHGRKLDIGQAARGERIAFDPQVPSPAFAPIWAGAVATLRSAFREVTPLGSLALEMARVANGDFDGFVSLGQPGGSGVADFAAGMLLIREAGGDVVGLDGRRDAWTSPVVLAGSPKTLEALRECMQGFSYDAFRT